MQSLRGDSVQEHAAHPPGSRDTGRDRKLFDGIAYGKTAAVLHMLESYLGHDTFRAGVNLYLKEHAYGNATAADFWNAMARSSKQPVDKIMPTFVLQPGAPFVDVEAKCEGGNTALTLSQKRYLDTPAEFNQPTERDLADPGLRQGGQRDCSRKTGVLPADAAATAVHSEGLLEICFSRCRCTRLLPV